MSIRAVILGLVAAVCIAGFGYFNDTVLRLLPLVSGGLLSSLIFGLLFLGMAVANPLLSLVRKSAPLRSSEAAVIVLLMMVGCSVPGAWWMDQFITTVAMPAHLNNTNPGWQGNHLMSYVPPAMFPADAQYDARVTEGFVSGLGRPGRPVGLDQVPWALWAKPIALWSVLTVLLAVCSICIGLIVNRQWSVHERLRYPIAEFANALLRRDEKRVLPEIFRSKLFWIGMGVIVVVRGANALNKWFPEQMFAIPLNVEMFNAIYQKWPRLAGQVPWAHELFTPTLIPVLVAFSFFLASDISFTLGVSQILWVAVGWVFLVNGVDMSSHIMYGGPMGWNNAGAYLALGVMILYIGRRYYSQVLRQAVTWGRFDKTSGDRPFDKLRANDVQRHVVWACRALLLGIGSAVVIISLLGLDWPLALATVLLMLLMFLCVSRIASETGLFDIQTRWQPLGLLLGLFGGFALGPQAIIIIGILCACISIMGQFNVMPFFVTGMKICDDQGVKPGRASWAAGATFAVCLAVAVPAVLWVSYNYGTNHDFGWTFSRVPSMPFDGANMEVSKLSMAGRLDESLHLSTLGRLTSIRPSSTFLWAAGSGFGLVILFSMLRLRLSWWPLHPILFLVWATNSMSEGSHSFLLGWALKSAATKFGGRGAYEQGKKLMVGVIAGEAVMALVFLVIGAVYYAYTGTVPLAFY